MPYPNEHSCRLQEPIDGAPTRRVNGDREHDGKPYDVIYQKRDGAWEDQAFRYPTKDWTADQAREHCKDHDGILFEPASDSEDDGKACVPCGEPAGLARRLNSNVGDWASRPWAIHRARLDAMSRRVETLDFAEPRTQERTSQAAGEEEDKGYQVVDAVAVVDVVGDIWKEVPWLYSWSGCEATSTLEVRAAIERAVEDPSVDAILLRIDSPGGIIDGVQELADAIYQARTSGGKPIHAYIEDLGASAAYWIGSQATRLSANMTAQIGSIGVYSVILDDSKASEKAGLRYHVVRSGIYKGTGAGEKITPDELVPYQEVVDDLAGMFASDVARGRTMTQDQARELATGRTWTAPKAKALGLLDGIESLEAAIRAAKPAAAGGDHRHGFNGSQFAGSGIEWSAGAVPFDRTTSEKEGRGMAVEEGNAADAPVVLTAEQIADSYPEAVESWRAEGREEGHKAGKAEGVEAIKALAEALPGRPEAALKAAIEGLSPVEAKAALADELAAENAELKSKAAALDGAEPVSASGAPASGEGDFLAEAKSLAKEKKLSLQEAMSTLASEKPDLHKAYKAGLRK